MSKQNIFIVSDDSVLPHGGGEIIKGYIEGVYSRVADKIALSEEPVDWAIVCSRDLVSVAFGSRSYFEEIFEDTLRERTDETLSVIANGSRGSLGDISKRHVESRIRESLGMTKCDFNYLTTEGLGEFFMTHHLKRG